MSLMVSYSVNGTGVGHLIRQRAIARTHVNLTGTSRANWVFITSSDSSDLVAQDGFPTFKIPSRHSLGSARAAEYEPFLAETVAGLVRHLSPALLVVDTFPTGAYNEVPRIAAHCPTALVARAVSHTFAATTNHLEAIGRFDALVLMQGAGDRPVRINTNAHVLECGPIISFDDADVLARADARRCLKVPEDDYAALVMLGGNQRDPLEEILSLVEDVARYDSSVSFTLASGPLWQRPMRSSIGNVNWITDRAVMRYHRAFDVAIATAGFNTFHELMHAGLPTIFVPVPRTADDQSERAAAAVAVGAAVSLPPGAASIATLTSVLETWRDGAARATASAAARALVPVNDATKVAKWLEAISRRRHET